MIATRRKLRRADKRVIREGNQRGGGGVSNVELHAFAGDKEYVSRYLEARSRRDAGWVA